MSLNDRVLLILRIGAVKILMKLLKKANDKVPIRMKI